MVHKYLRYGLHGFMNWNWIKYSLELNFRYFGMFCMLSENKPKKTEEKGGKNKNKQNN